MFTVTYVAAELITTRWRHGLKHLSSPTRNSGNFTRLNSFFGYCPAFTGHKRNSSSSPPPKMESPKSPLQNIINVDKQSPNKIGKQSPKKVEKTVLRFVKMTEHAFIPTKGSKHSAGYDLYSAYDYVVQPLSNALVKTDLQIALPDGCYGRVAPRSGLALKHSIDVGAGVVDQDYRGNLGVVLFNFGKEDFKISKGDRVAQLICEKIEYPEIEEVENLDATKRGSGGFGSTGGF